MIRKGPGQVVMGPQQPRPKLQDKIPSAPPRGTAQRGEPAQGHEHEWSDWRKPIFYRDSLGVLLSVGLAQLGGTDEPATTGWVRACATCDTEERA